MSETSKSSNTLIKHDSKFPSMKAIEIYDSEDEETEQKEIPAGTAPNQNLMQ